MVLGGHAVVETVGVVGVIGVIGVIGVAGCAFTRICGRGPATDAGQTCKVGMMPRRRREQEPEPQVW